MQRPHPPIVVGASPTPLHFRHIVEYGDAWMLIEGRFPVENGWAELQRMATEAGLEPATLELGVFGPKADSAHLAHLRDIAEKQRLTQDRNARKELVGDMQKRMAKNVWNFYWPAPDSPVVSSKKVHNFRPPPGWNWNIMKYVWKDA